MTEMKLPTKPVVKETEIVLHDIRKTGFSPDVYEAEIRVIVHLEGWKTVETVTKVELYEDD